MPRLCPSVGWLVGWLVDLGVYKRKKKIRLKGKMKEFVPLEVWDPFI